MTGAPKVRECVCVDCVFVVFVWWWCFFFFSSVKSSIVNADVATLAVYWLVLISRDSDVKLL